MSYTPPPATNVVLEFKSTDPPGFPIPGVTVILDFTPDLSSNNRKHGFAFLLLT
jgi:hypothetical protein